MMALHYCREDFDCVDRVHDSCVSGRLMYPRPRGAYEFCQGISMPEADNFQNEVVIIHKSQDVLNMLSPLLVDMSRN
jgi:hypothetical protein